MTPDYSPRTYWEDRLSRDFSLRGVGHKQFDERYNRWLYRAKQHCLVAALSSQRLVNRKVLDVGSGTGVSVRWYLESGATVHSLLLGPLLYWLDRTQKCIPVDNHSLGIWSN